ncbi:hypothetical protein OE09_3008 [Flavobacteriaceae bacterium MAR_2010_72]|nr:hypothetical protein OE09_3008 [Flavobacteriaceae bacterium MAR_2010_72]TVZ58303.1 hypothetical protein NA63_0799 [Flavobacteriaceae bacterium MAR_2010_105]
MNNKQLIVLVALCMGFVTTHYAQHRTYDIVNGFGIYGGITKFDIITDNFQTQRSDGWMGGMSATADIPHRWYNVSYSIQFSENNIDIFGRPEGVSLSDQPIEYKLFTAQVALLAHVKLVGSNVTLDAGPMIQYNSEMELTNEDQSNYILTNYNNLRAEDIQDISKFNVNGAVGLTVGFDSFKVKGQYIHGLTNTLNKLNDKGLDTSGNSDSKFKGNQSLLAFTVMFTF